MEVRGAAYMTVDVGFHVRVHMAVHVGSMWRSITGSIQGKAAVPRTAPLGIAASRQGSLVCFANRLWQPTMYRYDVVLVTWYRALKQHLKHMFWLVPNLI